MSDNELNTTSWPRRIIAYFIDSLVIGIVKGGVVVGSYFMFEDFSPPDADSLFVGSSSGGVLGFNSVFDVVMFLIGGVYWIYFEYRYGQTIGKRFMHTKTVKLDGSDISDVDSIVLAVGKTIPGLILFDVLFGMLFMRGRGQKVSNKITNTCVISE